MTTSKTLFFVSALFLITVSSAAGSSEQCRSFTQLAKNMNDFGFELSRQLDQTENLFISPFSIYTAIVMTYMGAKHNTAKQIENALQLDRDGLIGSDLQNSLKELLGSYLENEGGNYTLETANGMFLQNGFPVKEEYVNNVKALNQAMVMQVNFADESTKEEINGWVTERTHGMINDMLSDLDPLTKLILLSVVYFKGFWETPFNKRLTYDGTFHKSNGGTKTIKMMRMLMSEETFPFHEDPDTGHKYLELPYKGNGMVMLLALPRSAGDFPDTPMSSSELCDVFAKLNNEKFGTVTIPKFRFGYEKELKEPLMKLGIRDLFDSNSSDLTGMIDQPVLSVSRVLHKAVIDVNEEGSEAAAATAVQIVGYSSHISQHDFVADRPFLFYIIDKTNGVVLFFGRVNDP